MDKGFQMARSRGPLAGFEVVGARMVLEDGSAHAVDSSDLAFQVCARTAFRQAMRASEPVLLEPIMKVDIEVPTNFQGSVTGDIRLASRPGHRLRTQAECGVDQGPGAARQHVRLLDRSPLDDPGAGTFSMEFHGYQPVPRSVQEEVIEKVNKQQKRGSQA